MGCLCSQNYGLSTHLVTKDTRLTNDGHVYASQGFEHPWDHMHHDEEPVIYRFSPAEGDDEDEEEEEEEEGDEEGGEEEEEEEE